MPSVIFDLKSAPNNKSTALTISAGDFVRIRFTERSGRASAYINILANGVETKEPITDLYAWPSSAFMVGDSVWVSCTKLDDSFEVKGIMELGV
jgi:hypothetical protein